MKNNEQVEMTPKDRYELYKSLYLYEIQQPKAILGLLPILLAGLTILTSLVIEFFKSNFLINSKIPIWISVIFGVIVVLLSLSSIYYMFKASQRRSYDRLAIVDIEEDYIPKKIPKALSQIKEINADRTLKKSNDLFMPNASENSLLLTQFIKILYAITSRHMDINNDRLRYYHYSLYAFIANIIFIIIFISSVAVFRLTNTSESLAVNTFRQNVLHENLGLSATYPSSLFKGVIMTKENSTPEKDITIDDILAPIPTKSIKESIEKKPTTSEDDKKD